MFVPLAAAITIAPPGTSNEGCPSPRQVSDALSTRLPGAVLGPGQPNSPGTLRVTIFDPPGGGIRFQLTNADGETVLYRTLPPPPGRPSDCAALAETVALIVDRYLHEVGYEAPPLPPPTPPPAVAAGPKPEAVPPPQAHPRLWQLGVEAEGRVGGTDADGGALVLSLGVQSLPARIGWGVRLAGGATPAITRSFGSAGDSRLTLHRVPLRLSVFATLPAGPGRIEPGLDGGLDLLVLSVNAPNASGDGLHAAPFAALALGYSLPLARHVYVRLMGRGGIALPYAFLATMEGDSVLSTPRTYLEFGVESGVSFP